ncbi:hypothetical protein BH23ACT10_BH23ACT10_35560 [soil metagenome]
MFGVVLVVLLLVVAGLPALEVATAEASQVPPVDPYAPYESQDGCDPTPKPGVVGVRQAAAQAYPVSSWSSISRDCGVRGRSEHKGMRVRLGGPRVQPR